MSTKTIRNMLLVRLGEDISISSTSVLPDIDIFKQQDAIIDSSTRTDLPHNMISEEQLMFNPARP